MKKSITAAQIAALTALVLLGGACLTVRVRSGVQNADSYFERAVKDVRRLQSHDPDRQGRVHEVCILAYDQDAQELVQVTTPLWLAKACLDMALDSADREEARRFEERYGLDLESLHDLSRFGPGLLIEINDEDSRLLVWLR